jgi:hypothetical protein
MPMPRSKIVLISLAAGLAGALVVPTLIVASML